MPPLPLDSPSPHACRAGGGRRPCEDEQQQAVLRMRAVLRVCNNVSTKVFNTRASGNQDEKPLASNHLLARWPAHVALSRMLASSPASCRFKTTASMLRQQQLYYAMLKSDEALLRRCPQAWYAGGVNQVASVFNASDITGILILDWVPSQSVSRHRIPSKPHLP